MDPPVVPAAGAQVSIGRWIKDTDLEGQKAEHRKKAQTWRVFWGLTYSAVGVIYGDIGTSPLYTIASIFPSDYNPTKDDILGAVSIMCWSLTLIVIVKYMIFVFMCDDNGEGGTFAIYSKLCRFAAVSPGNSTSPDEADLQLTRYSSAMSMPRRSTAGDWMRAFFRKNRFHSQKWLLATALLGTSLVIGDGVLTPAQSVLGAIYGLQYKADISQSAVVGISCAIVIILFSLQPFGTLRVGACFSPIVIIWFTCNIITAIHNIASYQPGIFKLLSPYYIYTFFKHTRSLGWRSLAGIFLTVTGTETTFADLGHFSKGSIRMAFIGFAYPSLMLTYIGQAAYLMAYPENISNTFFASIPFGDGFYWFFFIFAVLAASVASQAIISGAFSIVKQSIALGCFPRVSVINTSKTVGGTIYIPEVNWLLMVLTIVVIAIFRTTTVLGNAYGVAVSALMFLTTILVTIAFIMVYDVNIFLALAFFLIFGFIDGTYLSANLNKVPKGGWFAIAVAGGIFIVSAIWWWGTAKKGTYQREHKAKLEDVVDAEPGTRDGLLDLKTGTPIARLPGVGFVYSDSVLAAPPLLQDLVHLWGGLHRTCVLITVRQVPIPHVLPEEQILFTRTYLPGIYRCLLRYGYLDTPDQGPAFAHRIFEQIVGEATYAAHEALANGNSDGKYESAPTENKDNSGLLADLSGNRIVYITSRPQLLSKPTGKVWYDVPRRFMLEGVYTLMGRVLARPASDSWNLPLDTRFEITQIYLV